MGMRILYAEIEGLEDKPEIGVPDNEDFLPIVRINEGEEPVNAIYSTKSCDTCKKQILDLGEDFDKKLRNYNIPEIVIAKSSTSYIPLENIQGYDGWGTQDGDGVLEFKCANSKVKFRLLNESTPKDCNDKTKLYDLKDAELGDKYSLEISHSLERGAKFSIEVWASDDNDGLWGKSDKVVKCGKLNFTVIEQDVFMKDEVKRLTDEIDYIKPRADSKLAPEYDENYCMQAAERGVSELLKNTNDFYAIERGTHKHKNRIGFSGLTAIDRGNKIKANGFVIKSWEYNGYTINQSKRKQINDSKSKSEAETNYGNVMYNIISLSQQEKTNFLNNFLQDIKNKQGFHVYYFCITGGFHTLLLIINNSNPCDASYAIYDQHGESTSKGKLENIGDGFARQTSWTFANTCLNRYIAGTTLHWDSTITLLWKIQRK